jgi:hypothetical protein
MVIVASFGAAEKSQPNNGFQLSCCRRYYLRDGYKHSKYRGTYFFHRRSHSGTKPN